MTSFNLWSINCNWCGWIQLDREGVYGFHRQRQTGRCLPLEPSDVSGDDYIEDDDDSAHDEDSAHDDDSDDGNDTRDPDDA